MQDAGENTYPLKTELQSVRFTPTAGIAIAGAGVETGQLSEYQGGSFSRAQVDAMAPTSALCVEGYHDPDPNSVENLLESSDRHRLVVTILVATNDVRAHSEPTRQFVP